MKLVEARYCPVCGEARSWAWGLVRHVVSGVKYVHVKMANDGKAMVSILKNGVRFLDGADAEA